MAPYQFEHLAKAEYIGLEPIVQGLNLNNRFQDGSLTIRVNTPSGRGRT